MGSPAPAGALLSAFPAPQCVRLSHRSRQGWNKRKLHLGTKPPRPGGAGAQDTGTGPGWHSSPLPAGVGVAGDRVGSVLSCSSCVIHEGNPARAGRREPGLLITAIVPSAAHQGGDNTALCQAGARGGQGKDALQQHRRCRQPGTRL